MAQIDDVLPYDLRDGWKDIRPIPQNDPVNAMAAIVYEPEYRHAMDAFRYIQSVQEISQRAIDLTEVIIRKNAGMFTVWNYRSMLLTSLSGTDLNKELDFMEGLIKMHLKGYQVWQHRKLIVLKLDDPSKELGFCARCLEIDSKNYHTWAYRHWVLCHFYSLTSSSSSSRVPLLKKKQVWAEELAYADFLLSDDVRNNSAWAHRFFICFESGTYEAELKEVATREIGSTFKKLQLVQNNASAWNYLRGIHKRLKKPLVDSLSQVRQLRNYAQCALACEFEADALAEQAKAQPNEDLAEQASLIYDKLGQELDPIRAPFYAFRKSLIEVGA